MIVKPRQMPLHLQKLDALLRRLPEYHARRQDITEVVVKGRAGYRGEQAVEYPLSFLPSADYLILHDLRLPYQNHYFQIDTLLLSKRFFLVLEIKNISGILYFDSTFHQMIRTYEGKEEAFPDPILQVKRQQEQLQLWLAHHRFLIPPLESLIVIATPRTIIKASPENLSVPQVVIHHANLLNKVTLFEKQYVKEIFTRKQLTSLAKRLQHSHVSLNQDVLKTYKINKDELIKGVFCSNCLYIPMQRKQGKWVCPACTNISLDAHLATLKDYALLCGCFAKNKEIREFLQLSSDSITKHILRSAGVPYEGKNKGRVYHLSI
ncbi:nuclease-related domain-containing protein [Bacillus sp. 165]|uniref:nuclease-related domain-containing protein n=1 Tax=Bacillus sp. 165 TaxID=1529117 RepID=UPI001ADCAA48|nr:nuclease-related domain-containing protein [Bacillus sp. 165]MBO9129906.1 NERD domain-containing protein [Bacillus sp. 165]